MDLAEDLQIGDIELAEIEQRRRQYLGTRERVSRSLAVPRS
jgi:hypothetical protein